MELLLLLAVVGALVLGYKIGTGSGKSRAETDIFMQIQSGLVDHTEFHRKYGVRGLHLLPPVGFPAGAMFVIVDAQDFQHLIGRPSEAE